jgi:outer membrane receptor protein involved in Fe transport
MNCSPPIARTVRVALCSAIATCALASAARAAEDKDLADLPLERLMQMPVQTVYTASRYEQKVTRAPASVSVVTSEDIARHGYRTLADVLRSAAGLFTTYDRNYTYLGVRGFSRAGDFNTRVLFLVDGHRVNDALYSLAYIGQEAVLDVEMIDRVEIIRGPASSIYGNSAILGVINVITRHGAQVGAPEIAADLWSQDSRKTRVAYGSDGKLAVTFSGSYMESEGHRALHFSEFDESANNNGRAMGIDGERAARFFGSASYGDFTLSAAYSKRAKDVPTAPYGTLFNSPLFYTVDERGYVDLKFERTLSPNLQLLARAAYDWYPYSAQFPYPAEEPTADVLLNRDFSLGRWVRTEVQVTQHLPGGHVLIAGAEYQDALRLHQQNYNVDPAQTLLDTNHSSRNAGVYAQSEVVLSKSLLLNAGLRYDHFESFGGTFNPRVGLIYSPRERTTFKALYGTAFRAPTEYEVQYESLNQGASAHLQPEETKTYELVAEHYLGQGTRLSVAAYQYRITSLITLADAADGSRAFVNAGDARLRGVELQVERRMDSGVSVSGSYSHQRSVDVGADASLGNSPRHLGKLTASLPFYRDMMSANVEAQYTSSSLAPNGESVGGFGQLNLTLLARRWLGNTDISASLYNLFDRSYRTPSADTGVQEAIGQDGRTFRIGLTYRPAQ